MENTNRVEISKNIILIGVLLVALTAACIVTASLGLKQSTLVAYVFMITFMVYHGTKRYGWKLTVFFMGLVTVVSWSYESLSILTGFPFGHYHYTENFFGPWVGLVPFTIMPAYLAMGYMSWTIASILLDKQDSSVKGSEVILLPLLSAFVMVMWDLSFDPAAATIGKLWDWHNGGAYFGVPFVNFLGWFLCVFTFFFIFALVLRFKGARTNVTISNKAFWILPPLMYLTRTIQYVLNVFIKDNVEITSNDGHVWWTGDIHWSLLLVSIFTMMFVVFYSIVRVSRREG